MESIEHCSRHGKIYIADYAVIHTKMLLMHKLQGPKEWATCTGAQKWEKRGLRCPSFLKPVSWGLCSHMYPFTLC